MRGLVLAALLSGAHSWSIGVHGTVDLLDPDGPNGTLGRWALAENTSTADALGGGISYAFDVKLCERLLPMFPEETVLQEYTSFFFPFPRFVDCGLIERKIQQAMAGWAVANTNVHFFEVTSLCNKGQGGNLSPHPPPYGVPMSPPNAPPGAPPRPSDPAPYPPSSPPAPGAPASNVTEEEPSDCDLGLTSCWTCHHAELDISFYDSAFADAGAAAAAAAAAVAAAEAAANASSFFADDVVSTEPEENANGTNSSDGNSSNFTAFSSSASGVRQAPSGRVLFHNVRAPALPARCLAIGVARDSHATPRMCAELRWSTLRCEARLPPRPVVEWQLRVGCVGLGLP